MQLNKAQLLQELSQVTTGGVAESENNNEQAILKNFLPSSQYKRIFEPNTFLMLGGRGVGKTELFRLLNLEQGRKELYKQTNSSTFQSLAQTHWLVAFKQTKAFPASTVIEKAVSNENWPLFWIGLLTGTILTSPFYKQHAIPLHPKVQQLLMERLSRPSEWLPLVDEHFEEINDFLDNVDDALIEDDQWLFLMYDELDKIVPSYLALAAPIRTLLAYWLENSRRWQRIRPKIFLRNDLFREDFLGFADASKLKPHMLRLEWTTLDLYQLLTKRLANKSKEWEHYLTAICHVPLKEDTTFGKVPAKNEARIYEDMMAAIIGRFMGANARKGKSYTWIPNHLQDGGGKIAPRSFLKLFSLAAEAREEKIAELSEKHLLLPMDLQNALQQTSEDRINELAAEEYPWLKALKQQLAGIEVPTEQTKLIQAIEQTVWTKEAPTPFTDPPALIDYLQRLGIIEIRLDKRINVPEIYLYGFDMKRRGGVKRAK